VDVDGHGHGHGHDMVIDGHGHGPQPNQHQHRQLHLKNKTKQKTNKATTNNHEHEHEHSAVTWQDKGGVSLKKITKNLKCPFCCCLFSISIYNLQSASTIYCVEFRVFFQAGVQRLVCAHNYKAWGGKTALP
jgi:hypothetical protein